MISARFWVKTSPTNIEDHSHIIQLLVEIADYLSSTEFVSFHEKVQMKLSLYVTYFDHIYFQHFVCFLSRWQKISMQSESLK